MAASCESRTEDAVLLPEPLILPVKLKDEKLSQLKEFFDRDEYKRRGGGIPIKDLKEVLCKEINEKKIIGRDLTDNEKNTISELAEEVDTNSNNRIDYEEFVALMRIMNPRLMEFPRTRFESFYHEVLKCLMPDVVKANNAKKEYGVQKYMAHFNCMPPPLFIFIVSITQLMIFIASIQLRPHQDERPLSAPYDSPLIYQPARRYEVWRFFTYMFIHDGWGHMMSNVVFQLLLGIPLEMVHKFWRIGTVYCVGVIIGSLATSVFDSSTALCGASGGVYALIGAHFAKIIMNWKELETHQYNSENIWKNLPILRTATFQLVFFSFYMILDTARAIYSRLNSPVQSRIAFVAHIAGWIGGVLVGILVLKNIKVEYWELVVGWIAISVFIPLIVFGIWFNISFPGFFPPTDWRPCCPPPCSNYSRCL